MMTGISHPNSTSLGSAIEARPAAIGARGRDSVPRPLHGDSRSATQLEARDPTHP